MRKKLITWRWSYADNKSLRILFKGTAAAFVFKTEFGDYNLYLSHRKSAIVVPAWSKVIRVVRHHLEKKMLEELAGVR